MKWECAESIEEDIIYDIFMMNFINLEREQLYDFWYKLSEILNIIPSSLSCGWNM